MRGKKTFERDEEKKIPVSENSSFQTLDSTDEQIDVNSTLLPTTPIAQSSSESSDLGSPTFDHIDQLVKKSRSDRQTIS